MLSSELKRVKQLASKQRGNEAHQSKHLENTEQFKVNCPWFEGNYFTVRIIIAICCFQVDLLMYKLIKGGNAKSPSTNETPEAFSKQVQVNNLSGK